mmetsp:Transcript_22207/g.46394  ORF Transcript_22207/g.46394 Transcript_22207/m.46394 type:complete len:268 (-) Transcript_22207:555-1358(-)
MAMRVATSLSSPFIFFSRILGLKVRFLSLSLSCVIKFFLWSLSKTLCLESPAGGARPPPAFLALRMDPETSGEKVQVWETFLSCSSFLHDSFMFLSTLAFSYSLRQALSLLGLTASGAASPPSSFDVDDVVIVTPPVTPLAILFTFGMNVASSSSSSTCLSFRLSSSSFKCLGSYSLFTVSSTLTEVFFSSFFAAELDSESRVLDAEPPVRLSRFGLKVHSFSCMDFASSSFFFSMIFALSKTLSKTLDSELTSVTPPEADLRVGLV